MEELLFSQITLTRRSSITPRVVRIKSENELQGIKNAVARYEFARGIEGSTIIDLTSLKGVEDLGDKIRILAGTKWREVLPYKPEIYANLDFSVGGSVAFGDAGFGFNEFGFVRDRVEVEAYLNGVKYIGKYKGGIIYAVYVRKESKELVSKSYKADTLDAVIYKLKSWFQNYLPPFRDITVVYSQGSVILNVAYTRIREVLLQRFLDDMQNSDIIYEDLSSRHEYRYFGLIDFKDIESLKENIKKSEKSFLRFKGEKVFFSIYSHVPLVFPSTVTLLPYSDSADKNNLNGCVLCGRCVDVCPYGELMGSPVYTPIGLYVLNPLGVTEGLINCHQCGRCVDVCPSKLDIISLIKKNAKYNFVSELPSIKELPAKSVIVLTRLSHGLEDRAIRAILYYLAKNKKVGVIVLDIDINNLLTDSVDWNSLSKKLDGIYEIFTITPEEYYYLQTLASLKSINISLVEQDALQDADINSEELHVPCLLRLNIGGSNKCSLAFLERLNKIDEERKQLVLNEKIKYTLCPITAQKYKLKSPLDMIIPSIDLRQLSNIVDKFRKGLQESVYIIDDAKWYEGVCDELYTKLTEGIYQQSVKSLSLQELVILYFFEDKANLSESEKRIIDKEVVKIFNS
jgi:ferredoxin